VTGLRSIWTFSSLCDEIHSSPAMKAAAVSLALIGSAAAYAPTMSLSANRRGVVQVCMREIVEDRKV